jgi:16S rRNA (adenine1518-N6/adenine1519-N6)-dimethyltransferase
MLYEWPKDFQKTIVFMQIDELPPLRDVILKYNLEAKKSLGQNFLHDLNLTSKIALLSGSIENSTILEIGAGPGALTRGLLASGAKKVIALERDKRCIPALMDIADYYNGKLEILERDALKFDLNEIKDLGSLKIISNLPYNIGTELLVKWLTPIIWPPKWEDMTLMFQKEVADRIVAIPGTKAYGRLSILTQWRCDANIRMTVSPDAFRPKPKVQSAVVSIKALNTPKFYAKQTILEKLVKAGFGQRRKMIRSSLKSFDVNINTYLQNVDLKPTLRAENLTVSDWCRLAEQIEKK